MIKIQLLSLLTAAAIVLPASTQAKTASATPAPAAAMASPSASPAAKKDRPIPYYGKIASVDASAKTFTISSKSGKDRVFKVVSTSVITKGGTAATFASIVKDEEVRGSYWKKADGSMETKSVKLGPLTPEEQAAKDAKTAAKKTSAPAAGVTPPR